MSHVPSSLSLNAVQTLLLWTHTVEDFMLPVTGTTLTLSQETMDNLLGGTLQHKYSREFIFNLRDLQSDLINHNILNIPGELLC